MYATTCALLAVQAVRSARPRPFSSRCRHATPGSAAVRSSAIDHVRSVLALSAMVTAHVTVKRSVR